MMVLLLLSKSTVSLQAPFCFPIFSLTPNFLKPAFSWMRRLPMFSGKIPACNVHIPSISLKVTSSSKSGSPTPFLDCSGSTYTLTSATPAYTNVRKLGSMLPSRSLYHFPGQQSCKCQDVNRPTLPKRVHWSGR